jgi:hypothetical protein
MKKLAAVGAVMGLLPALALAVGNHPMSGCGLGYLLFSNKDNSKVTQVLGATTNGTFGSQTFGITSGTSGCTEDGAVKFAKETETFAEVNLPNLQREMAAGEGEYVMAFATLLGASDSQRPVLVSFMQKHYSEIFPTPTTGAGEMLESLAAQLQKNPEVLG